MKKPALIFDFGNVVAFFDYSRIGTILGRHVGLSGEQFLETVRASGFTPLLQAYESGHLSDERFGEAVCALVGLDLPHEQFAAAWRDIFWLNPPVADLVTELKTRGYSLVLGSNTNALHATHFLGQFAEPLEMFDHLVFSYQVGHIKPSAPFYRACADAAGVPPSECVFVDDLAENVEGATAAGLQALLFTNVSKLRDDLRGLGVEC